MTYPKALEVLASGKATFIKRQSWEGCAVRFNVASFQVFEIEPETIHGGGLSLVGREPEDSFLFLPSADDLLASDWVITGNPQLK